MGSIKKHRKITNCYVVKFSVSTISALFKSLVEYIFLNLLRIYLGSVFNIYDKCDYRLKSYK